MNTSDGPASGSMPAEKQAGKMMMPAITATSVSMALIWKAVFTKCVSFEKYDAYVHRQPMPMLSE